MQDRDVIAEARRRRQPLHDAAYALEDAAAAPAGTGPVWGDRLRKALDVVSAALDDHIERTEGPNGLYREIQDSAPRVANDVRLLTKDHAVIRGTLDELELILQAHADGSDATLIRELVMDILRRIIRHRQIGADLVYQAYHVDIGGQA